MNIELFLAKRIIFGEHQSNRFSKPIVRIATMGIAIGLVVMILTIAIVTGFQSEIRDKIIGFGSHIQITNYDSNTSFEPNPISRNPDFYPILKNTKGIKHIQIYAIKNGIIKTKTDNEGVLLKGIGKDYDWTFIKKHLIQGSAFNISDSANSKNIVISKILASRLELKVNDKLLIYFITKSSGNTNSSNLVQSSSTTGGYEQRVKDFYISGIYETGFEEFDKKMVLVDIGQIQKLNYWNTDQIGGFEVTINKYDDIDKMGAEVYDLTGDGFNAQTIKEVNSTIFSWLALQDINAIIVITLMVLVAAINMISALLILILERTNMIGILKALGAGNGSIRKVFLYNAAYLIGQGLIWGNFFGIGLCLIQKQFGIITLPQETYYVSVIPININLGFIALLNVGTLVICLLMLIIPSFIISKITPVKAIRFS